MRRRFKDYFGKYGIVMLLIMLACSLFGVFDGGALAADAYIPATGKEDVTTGREGQGVHVDDKAITTEVTRNVTDDILLTEYDQIVVKCFPNKTPLDTIMRYAKQRDVTSLKVKWGAVDIKPFNTKTTSVYSANNSIKTAVISVENPKIFNKTSTLRVEGIYGYEEDGSSSTEKLLMLYVMKVDGGAKQITVQAVNGPRQTGGGITDMYVPSIPSGTTLYRMGKAASEKDIKTESTGSLPSFYDNYCQSFKCQVDVSEWYKKSSKTVEWDKQDMQEMAIYEWKMELESSFLFGIKGIIHDDDKDEDVLTCAGIVNFIKKEFQYNSFTKEDLVDLTKAVFTGNSGSDRRVMFAGSDLVAAISKIDYTQFKDISMKSEVQWGIKWRVIETNFGSIYLVHHELMDEQGRAGDGVVIDPEFLNKYVFEKEHNRELDLKTTGVANVDSTVTTEVCCPGLKYPACHLYIKYV